MIRLSHLSDDDGYSDIRATVERMFAERPVGVGVAELERFGWFELLDEAPAVAARAMFEGQGAHLAVAGTLDGYVVHSLVREKIELPAAETTSVLVATPQRAGRLFATVAPNSRPTHFIFQSPVARDEVLLLAASAACAEPIRSVDSSVELLTVDVTAESRAETLVSAAPGLVQDHTYLALSLQLTGMCDHLLKLGRDYVRTRQQFGRPIGTFQSVQHLLANAAVSIAAAHHATMNAATTPPDSARLSALVAAGASSRAFDTTSRTVQQVLGAIGYTREHEFHRYLRRGLLLMFLLGADSLDQRIGELVREGGIPVLAPASSWYETAGGAGRG